MSRVDNGAKQALQFFDQEYPQFLPGQLVEPEVDTPMQQLRHRFQHFRFRDGKTVVQRLLVRLK